MGTSRGAYLEPAMLATGRDSPYPGSPPSSDQCVPKGICVLGDSRDLILHREIYAQGWTLAVEGGPSALKQNPSSGCEHTHRMVGLRSSARFVFSCCEKKSEETQELGQAFPLGVDFCFAQICQSCLNVAWSLCSRISDVTPRASCKTRVSFIN